MRAVTTRSGIPVLLAMLAIPAWSSLSAQQETPPEPGVIVKGTRLPDGPEVKGIISARSGDRIQVTAADGTSTVVVVDDETRIKGSNGLLDFKRSKLSAEMLRNGLPVTVKTWQAEGALLANQISFRKNDLKIAEMIRNGTAQRFDEQAAATEALRGRMGDIDKYNIKSTTNVYFDTGKTALSPQAKAELCSVAAQAEAMDNALMLVVGYTDSTGSDEYNQLLSEKRAGSVINFLQQACHWKPYRMLTPTGMAEADPLASNDTAAGKAQNRRVSVNVLVSKGLDGL